MIDSVYVLATILFFALMIGYVYACDRLGSANDIEREGRK